MTTYESQDNRKYKRHSLACPVTVYSASDDVPTTTATGDVSDGGVFMAVPVSRAPDIDSKVDLTFCVPRKSSGVDCFSVTATVVRQDVTPNEAVSGLALQFKKPISLKLS
ncbi:MAG: PilZ domain-containing protein [Phycisphaerae bacterium]|nr:PilZ domain-containing protein [Phycisphaerae bacterium]